MSGEPTVEYDATDGPMLKLTSLDGLITKALTMGNDGQLHLNGLLPPPDNYILSYDTTLQLAAVANTWQDLKFSNNTEMEGWTHTVNTNVFGCPVTAWYQATIFINAGRSGGGSNNCGFRAKAAGTEIVGSYVSRSVVTNNTDFPLFHSFIFKASGGTDIKTEMYAGQTTTGVNGCMNGASATTTCSAIFTLTRLV